MVATDDACDPVDTLGSKNEPITLVLNPSSNVAAAYPGEAPPDRCEEQVLCPPEFPGCEDPDALAPSASTPAFRSKQRLSLHFAADVGFAGETGPGQGIEDVAGFGPAAAGDVDTAQLVAQLAGGVGVGVDRQLDPAAHGLAHQVVG